MPEPRELLDQPKAVREGETLDVEALAAWLEVEAGTVEVLQFPAGYSNLTYMLQVGERELVLRRPPFGDTVASGHDMQREYSVLSKLAPVYPLAPEPIGYCDDPAILGAPFYVMERIRGVIIRRRPPKGMTISPERARALSTALIDGLAELHGIDWRAIGLGDLGKPAGYARRQIEGWTRRWNRAKTDEVPALDVVAAWLDARQGDDDAANGGLGPALIHNDYKYDNVVLKLGDDGRDAIVGVLDWEMATIGSPLMDLGTTLGYWVDRDDDARLQGLAFGPTNLPGSLTRAELVDRYQAQSGREVGDPVFYRVFGLFKIAVIIQQIYARFKQGSTRDPRFEALGYFVTVLAEVASDAIDRDRA